ncbi:MAG: alpha-N-acetylglucosaminidase TIM-barrel domain-containing protein [Odoribacter splanchnicus]
MGRFPQLMLSPEEELFTQIGQLFIEEWEKEFGKNDFYLADSFNEMDVPFPLSERKKDTICWHFTENRYTKVLKLVIRMPCG